MPHFVTRLWHRLLSQKEKIFRPEKHSLFPVSFIFFHNDRSNRHVSGDNKYVYFGRLYGPQFDSVDSREPITDDLKFDSHAAYGNFSSVDFQ